MVSQLRRYLLTGMVVAVPLLVTVTIIRAVIQTVDGWVAPLLPDAVMPYAVPGLGLLLALISLTLLGAFAANVAGRWLIAGAEALILRLPLVGSIYRPVRQVLDQFRPGARNFRSVVLLPYPCPGSQSLGFITADAPPEIGADKCAVFVPTSPNLYAGFLLFLPRDVLTPLSMSVEEAIRLQVSAGLAQGKGAKPPLPSSRA